MTNFQLFHVTNKAIIIHKNKVLTLTDNEHHNPVGLVLPGGRMDQNEDILDGLKRELYEELGLIIDNKITPTHYKTICLTPKEYNLDEDKNLGLIINYFIINIPDTAKISLTMEDNVTKPIWIGKEDRSKNFYIHKISEVVKQAQQEFLTD